MPPLERSQAMTRFTYYLSSACITGQILRRYHPSHRHRTRRRQGMGRGMRDTESLGHRGVETAEEPESTWLDDRNDASAGRHVCDDGALDSTGQRVSCGWYRGSWRTEYKVHRRSPLQSSLHNSPPQVGILDASKPTARLTQHVRRLCVLHLSYSRSSLIRCKLRIGSSWLPWRTRVRPRCHVALLEHWFVLFSSLPLMTRINRSLNRARSTEIEINGCHWVQANTLEELNHTSSTEILIFTVGRSAQNIASDNERTNNWRGQ